MNNVYHIKAALSTSLPLSGIGDEAIIDIVTGEVIARFYNGNFVSTNINKSTSPLSSVASNGIDATLILDDDVA